MKRVMPDKTSVVFLLCFMVTVGAVLSFVSSSCLAMEAKGHAVEHHTAKNA